MSPVSSSPEHHAQSSEYELLPGPGGPPAEPHKKATPPSRTSKILDTWLYEGIAVVFSLACFIAIIAILMVYNHKPAPSFAYGLTLNAIISVLATASKSSLIYVIAECMGQLKWIWFYKGEKTKPLSGMQVFDSASRGPLDSLVMVFQHRGRRSLVSLGAVIVVLALAFDPFMQQILTYPVRERVVQTGSRSAAAKRASVLLLESLGVDLQSIVYSGQWADSLDVAPTCPSGNCTWPAFRSIGMCSQCEDITSSTAFECPPLELNNMSAMFEEPKHECRIVPPQGEPGSVTLILQPFQFDPHTIHIFELAIPHQIVWAPFALRASTYVLDNPSYAGIRNPQLVLAHAELILADNTTAGFSPLLNLEQTLKLSKVTQCALALCARTYHISVSNGVASSNVSSPDYGQMFFINTSNGTVSRNVSSSYYDTSPNGRWLSTDIEPYWKPGNGSPVTLTNITSSSWANTSESAFAPVTDYYRLEEHLAGEAVTYYFISEDSAWMSPDKAWMSPHTYNDSNIARILSIGLQDAMGRVAASLTKTALTASNDTVDGTVFVVEGYVAVNWGWILLPAALVVLGVVFWALTVAVNRRVGMRLWKSSVLAVLFHGVRDLGWESGSESESEDGDGDGDGKYATVSQMEKAAEGVKVRLRNVGCKKGLVLDQSGT